MKLNILPSECSCDMCSSMCHSPCCGTPEDIELLMEKGYGNRLMYDDLPGGEDLIKPSLKGYEGKKSPWETSTRLGCTFWHNGKCELHVLGIKPSVGKLAHHSLNDDQYQEIADVINDSWKSEKGSEVIEKWKIINKFTE